MSDRFFHGYWRLKNKVDDLEHELELRVEYAQDLEARIAELEGRVQLCLGDALALTDRAINDGLTLCEVETLLRKVY